MGERVTLYLMCIIDWRESHAVFDSIETGVIIMVFVMSIVAESD